MQLERTGLEEARHGWRSVPRPVFEQDESGAVGGAVFYKSALRRASHPLPHERLQRIIPGQLVRVGEGIDNIVAEVVELEPVDLGFNLVAQRLQVPGGDGITREPACRFRSTSSFGMTFSTPCSSSLPSIHSTN